MSLCLPDDAIAYLEEKRRPSQQQLSKTECSDGLILLNPKTSLSRAIALGVQLYQKVLSEPQFGEEMVSWGMTKSVRADILWRFFKGDFKGGLNYEARIRILFALKKFFPSYHADEMQSLAYLKEFGDIIPTICEYTDQPSDTTPSVFLRLLKTMEVRGQRLSIKCISQVPIKYTSLKIGARISEEDYREALSADGVTDQVIIKSLAHRSLLRPHFVMPTSRFISEIDLTKLYRSVLGVFFRLPGNARLVREAVLDISSFYVSDNPEHHIGAIVDAIGELAKNDGPCSNLRTLNLVTDYMMDDQTQRFACNHLEQNSQAIFDAIPSLEKCTVQRYSDTVFSEYRPRGKPSNVFAWAFDPDAFDWVKDKATTEKSPDSCRIM